MTQQSLHQSKKRRLEIQNRAELKTAHSTAKYFGRESNLDGTATATAGDSRNFYGVECGASVYFTKV